MSSDINSSKEGDLLMPQGKVDPATIPDDGLTTRQRRMLPITAVHTGQGKGKSTAAFGMAVRAWNQGMNIGVFQFVKSAKWKVGEEAVFKQLGKLYEDSGIGGPVEWHKMGEGWSWTKKQSADEDHARDAQDGWAEIKNRIAAQEHDFYVLDEFTYPIKWGWIDVDDVVDTLKNRPGTQHIVITGRDADPKLIEAADLVTEMTKIKHPMDVGRKGQKGIEW
ncbi:Cob (I) yrinic acid a,c-diamide adenosyltransferase [Corynebacterium pseudotuberculosis]|nr:cob (I) yrinic acid a,c-diamide adenosyltransferase [Corynebacterium pseudotuberculosis 3/99-5]AFH52244.1 cob (I) yrinic acid a,c-diamide adenosyltransferase [Corynebacterium pseudotuberculosis 267]AIG07698.1 Cob(I)alamin adenosyltransferase [Corynebacterium pseudotuberculosis]AIG09949.1 Cob(I)alamin adenosyltransferase [Corynebacterium pseudotuberculosis]AKC74057.1 Cob (I) yrinic acid a,c-diamide adenosyltransferase [Corynebacterium pseudotuberculosis]